MNNWKESKPSEDGTHHVTDNGPLYEDRFDSVLSFHEPGLAPAYIDGKWFHITAEGKPSYKQVFDEAFGFYYNRAAVRVNEDWFHILPNGQRAYPSNYSWCGNYQQELCAVRESKGQYFHINLDGAPIYDEKYFYVGDYREGFAVVKNKTGCTHIDANGQLLHGTYYRDLGVYHKGHATARDDYGWFHIDKKGNPLYSQHYKLIEPFYNGLALCEKLDGRKIRISPSGQVIEQIDEKEHQTHEKKILLIGNLSSDKTTLGKKIQNILKYDHVRIDECRRKLSDGTVTGEYRAWRYFITRCEEPKGTILEFSGGGPHVYNIALALENSSLETHIIWLDLPLETCLEVSRQRTFDSPYPYPMGDLEELIIHIAKEIEAAWNMVWTKKGFKTHKIENPRTTSPDEIFASLEI